MRCPKLTFTADLSGCKKKTRERTLDGIYEFIHLDDSEVLGI